MPVTKSSNSFELFTLLEVAQMLKKRVLCGRKSVVYGGYSKILWSNSCKFDCITITIYLARYHKEKLVPF